MGRITVDGYDLRGYYGAFVAFDGYKGFLSFPESKEVEYNDWAEEEGIDADLECVHLSSRQFELPLWFMGDGVRGTSGFTDFCNLIKRNAALAYEFEDFGVTMVLRMRSFVVDELKDNRFLKATFTFSEDMPLLSVPDSWSSCGVNSGAREYYVDGVPFRTYNIRVLGGTRRGFYASAAKGEFSMDLSTLDGVISQRTGLHRRASKEIVFKCQAVAQNKRELYSQLASFVKFLIRQNEDEGVADTERCVRHITGGYIPSSGGYRCYYKSLVVDRHLTGDRDEKEWAEFTLRMVRL